jgi:anaphase-promoting complex subunit 8
MNNYALYYYSRAVLSRPKDSRMWNAMGCFYEKMGKSNERRGEQATAGAQFTILI